MKFKFVLPLFIVVEFGLGITTLDNLDLLDDHLLYHLSNYPVLGEKCLKEESCPKKHLVQEILKKRRCWGYEPRCDMKNAYSKPECPGDSKGWVSSKEDQIKTFFKQGDFGYIREQLNEMSIMCEPTFKEDSSLECSKHLRFCRGRNIRVDFADLANRTELLRYKMDVLSEGRISGKCLLHKERLMEECDQISPLQSWGPEMRFFTPSNAPFSPSSSRVYDQCDVVVDKPTFILKIDAAINMYHHFCDFFNLYASQHLNSSHPEAFSKDVHILIWESYRYQSSFKETFQAFTNHPLWDLNTFRGRRVCFSNVVFPLLPRMIFGLYYNTPIIWGCKGSGLFRAFSEHILHRLRVAKHPPHPEGKLRVTLLSRESSYRNILNENKLLGGLMKNPKYDVKRVVYNNKISFRAQLESTRNSDIFIGIHGAGLTHLLFLPDWAVVVELYNCEDESCYLDLARLRGVHYITWEKPHKVFPQDEGHHPEGGAHAKFTNYKFDLAEFLRLIGKAEKYVFRHPKYREFASLPPLKDEL